MLFLQILLTLPLRTDFLELLMSSMPIKDIALTFVPRLGTRAIVHLLECFGSAEAIYASSAHDLISQAELHDEIARSIVKGAGMREAEREASYCLRHGIEVIASTDERYPALLRETDDYPAVIYLRGHAEALQRPSVAFVGTRKISSYGQHMCNELIEGFAKAAPNAVVVSGLAYGVDSACHRAALQHGLTTIGVIANPLPQITPVAHQHLAEDMIAHGGAVITELSSQTKQNGRYYIPRNRIIAAIAAGTVVVESPEAGGSLSTAAFADGYNRTVMALPARTTDINSRGCNLLIRNRKAQAILSGEDIAREVMWDMGLDHIEEPKRERQPLTADEERLIALFDNEPITIDALLMRSGLSAGELSLHLMTLELSGAIRQLPGKQYEKLI